MAPLTGSAAGSPEDRHEVRVHWTEVARGRLDRRADGDQFGLDVLAVSRADLERYRAFYREVRGPGQ